jgi:methyl-accepting chemotaxis protein
LDNLSIKNKLYVVFGVLIAIFFATSIFAGYSLRSINEGALRISTEHIGGVIAASESSQTMADYRQNEFAIATASDLPSRIYAIQNGKKMRDQLNISFDKIEPTLTGESLENFKSMRELWMAYAKDSLEMINMAQNSNSAGALKKLADSNEKYQQIDAKLVKVIENRKDFITCRKRICRVTL